MAPQKIGFQLGLKATKTLPVYDGGLKGIPQFGAQVENALSPYAALLLVKVL